MTEISNLVTPASAPENRVRKRAARRIVESVKERTVLRTLVCILLAFVTLDIAHAEKKLNELLVPSAAYDVQRPDVGDPRSYHVYYKINLDYPRTAIALPQFEALKNAGWRECSGGNADWDSHAEVTDKGETGVHQQTRYWSKGDRLLTINMRYYSTVSRDKKFAGPPKDSVQYVYILVDSGKGLRTKHLGISCG